MILDFEEYVIDIIEHENRIHGNKFDIASISPLGSLQSAEKPGDSATHLFVKGFDAADDVVVSVSNYRFPDAVGDAVERCREFFSRVQPHEAESILRPIIVGCYGEQSYAFWSKQQPLSPNRIIRKIQLHSINRHVFSWLRAVTQGSSRTLAAKEEILAKYIEPISSLIRVENVSVKVKNVAKDALRIVEGDGFQAVCAAQHGDFWYGNILLSKYWPLSIGGGRKFYVIDWGGSNADGYPFVDLLQYLMSQSFKNSRTEKEIDEYGAACGLKVENVHAYICAGLGYLGMHRREFPATAFSRLCDAMIEATPITKLMDA